MVLAWDATEFCKQASQIESAKDKPTKQQLAILREYMDMPFEAKQALRGISMEQKRSIVAVIFDTKSPNLTASLSESQHSQCLGWLSAMLSARDRDEITKVLCKSNPDYLTSTVREAVTTYEPSIRDIHEAMDLREHVTSIETFTADFLETSKPKKTKSGWRLKKNDKNKLEDITPPSVEDYVALINRNIPLVYNYLHQFAKNCVSLREQFRSWANLATKEFRQQHESAEYGGAGAISDKLQNMYLQLPPGTQRTVLANLDAHASYLSQLDNLSELRMQRVLDQLTNQSKSSRSSSNKSSACSSPSPLASSGEPSMSGPGVYLMRWDALLDETIVTPATLQGPLRHGRDIKGQKAWGKTVSDSVKGGWDAGAISKEENRGVPIAPNVDVVLEMLGEQFKDLVNEKIGEIVPSVSEKVGYLMRGEGIPTGVDGAAFSG